MRRVLAQNRIAVTLLLALAANVAPAASLPAIASLAKQADRHPLIMLGEQHRSRQIHDFLQQLLRDPAFICRMNDVVIEFGNSRLQALADDYTAGKVVSQAQLQSLWRETVVPLTWNSPVYRQVYETVRAINRARLCPQPVRLVLGDPPLDWSRVANADDLVKFADRDGFFADVVEREVLAKRRRALLVAGRYHAMKRVPPEQMGAPDERVAAQIIAQRHPGVLFTVMAVPSPRAAVALKLPPPPSFSVVRGSALAEADFAMTYDDWVPVTAAAAPADKGGGLRIGEVTDGLLHLGGNHSVYPSPAIYLDPVYQQELRRRAAIIKAFNGQDFLPGIDALVKQAETAAASAVDH